LCAARTVGDPGDITGITLFLVDVATGGVHVRGVASMLDEHFVDVELDAVFVPDERVVGLVHAGWAVLSAALPYERTAVDYAAKNLRWLAAVRRGLVGSPSDALLDRFVDLHARARAGRLLAWQVVDALAQDMSAERVDRVSAVAKWWNSQLSSEIVALGLEVHGVAGTLSVWDGEPPAGGLIEAACRESPSFAVSAGTSEMMLRILAASGLGP
jgi:alkylation response protein AidB-like acyl-CoA dehydrogenase